MTSVEEHTSRVLALADPLPAVELPLAQCLGRVLAEDVAAKLAVPPFTNSGMDGFAVRVADVADATEESPVILPVSGDIPAGVAPSPLLPGTAQRIMTGAQVPEGAEAVVQVEHTDHTAGVVECPSQVAIKEAPQSGRHIRFAGENVQVGETVLRQGEVVTSAVLAAAASVGYGTLKVVSKPRVGVLSTGSELEEPGVMPAEGHIPDSNSTMLAALANEFDAECSHMVRAKDDPSSVEQELLTLAKEVDLVITSGGVSAGAFDVIKQLNNIGEINFDKIAMQPGKPQGFGFIQAGGRRVPILAFPGNPVSSFISFHLYARPLLAKMAGDKSAESPLKLSGFKAATSWSSPSGRRQFTPVVTIGEDEDGFILVAPSHTLHSGSHLIASLHLSDALMVTPEEQNSVAEGDEVIVIPTRKDYR